MCRKILIDSETQFGTDRLTLMWMKAGSIGVWGLVAISYWKVPELILRERGVAGKGNRGQGTSNRDNPLI